MFSVIFSVVLVLIFAPMIITSVAKLINWGKGRVIKSYETAKDVFKGETK